MIQCFDIIDVIAPLPVTKNIETKKQSNLVRTLCFASNSTKFIIEDGRRKSEQVEEQIQIHYHRVRNHISNLSVRSEARKHKTKNPNAAYAMPCHHNTLVSSTSPSRSPTRVPSFPSFTTKGCPYKSVVIRSNNIPPSCRSPKVRKDRCATSCGQRNECESNETSSQTRLIKRPCEQPSAAYAERSRKKSGISEGKSREIGEEIKDGYVKMTEEV